MSSRVYRLGFHLVEHRLLFGELCEEILPHGVQKLDDERIAHGIEHLIPGLAADQNSLCTQNRQMLRGVRLFHSETLDQGAGGEFAVTELLDYRDASGVGERLKEFGFKTA